jgi:hypothetical protein
MNLFLINIRATIVGVRTSQNKKEINLFVYCNFRFQKEILTFDVSNLKREYDYIFW